MKRTILAITLGLLCIPDGIAQQTPAAALQSPADAPATKEDIERYLEVMHMREIAKQMMGVMSKSMREMVHEQAAKNRTGLPPDAEERMNKRAEEWLKSFPIDEMLQVMVSVYQKHWTKADVDNIIAFYSTPTGQKLLTEMPQTMAEAMQAMRPIMEKQMDGMRQKVEQEVAQLKKEQDEAQSKKAAPVSN
jgi:hypothetical protein